MMVGQRALKFRGTLVVIDEKNDLLSFVEIDPDERGFFGAISKKKTTYPDYFKGIVTKISKNGKYSKKDDTWTVTSKDKHQICSIEGEFTNHLKFENDIYWQYSKDAFPKFKRMAFTLPSDSTFREDVYWLKKKDEDMCQKFKTKLEEIQRADKKLREANAPKEVDKKKKK
jgi:hypothetical protein